MLRFRVLRLPVAGLIALACSKEKPAEPVAIPAVIVMGSDYAFQMPDTLSAGVTTFRLMNQGNEVHHIVLIRLAEGQTAADMMNLGPATPPPVGMAFLGGPNAAAPGGSAEATLDLQPGRYVAVCLIPAPDGQPHMRKGMLHEFTVVPAQSAAVAPTADVTVKLSDFAFEISPALSPGRHVIRIENGANQWHEMVFVKLEPGKTVGDFAQWAEQPQGPPPAMLINGAAVLGPGGWNTVVVELTPGDYGLVCFLPDMAQGKSHLMLGMMQQVKVM